MNDHDAPSSSESPGSPGSSGAAGPAGSGAAGPSADERAAHAPAAYPAARLLPRGGAASAASASSASSASSAEAYGVPPTAARLLAPRSPSTALLYRLGTVALLTVLLLIPLQLIRSAITERSRFRDEAIARVVKNTTGEQQLIGPLLVIPWTDTYEEQTLDANGILVPQRKELSGTVLRTPATSAITGQLAPSKLRVGLYQVSVYQWRGTVKASFQGELPLPTRGSRTWGAPYVVFAISDVRGLVGAPVLTVDGQRLPLAAGTRAMTAQLPGMHANLPPITSTTLPAAQLSFELTLKGTHSLRIMPLADDNRVELTSSWPHPKFDGYSPRSTISDDGFKALWEISALASDARAKLLGRVEGSDVPVEKAGDASLSRVSLAGLSAEDTVQVSLVDPVDVYTQTDRASKYGILFLVLTFVGFIAFELIKRLPIHPVQYLLVGLALAIFFLMLLSLSEHLAFWQAYLASASACIGLQVLYLSGVLKSWLRASGFAVMLTALYGVLYSLLASEDNALLMGSLLLFAVLSAIMWATRKIDWYEVGAQLR